MNAACLDIHRNGGAFEGYASLFGVVDLLNDCVEPGAFDRSIKVRKPRMLLNHNPAMPIGTWASLAEDTNGLFVSGKLETPFAELILDAMRAGELDGLSIGFRTIRASRQEHVRHIVEADLWEVSLVPVPALPTARVVRLDGQLRMGTALP